MGEHKVPTFTEHLNEEMSSLDLSDDSNITDDDILRAAIRAELDAISLYGQMAKRVKDNKIRNTLLDIAREEQVHIGEFESLLKNSDPDFVADLKKGEEETKENE